MQTIAATSTNENQAVRVAALAGAIGPLLFAALVIVGGVLWDGYDHTAQKISELGGAEAEFAILQILNFIMVGVAVIGLAWALGRWFGPSYLGPALIALFGLSSAIGNGLLPCDAGCAGVTTVGLLHNATGLLGFIAAIVGMLVLARRWWDEPRWQGHARFTLAAALVAIVGLAWFVATQAVLEGEPLAGVAQRVFVIAFLTWLTITGVHLYRESQPPDTRSEADRGFRPAARGG